jgi:8-amino-7-oxononanoate synthase
VKPYNQILTQLKTDNLFRQTRAISAVAGPIVTHDGRPFINFSSNDYLGLAQHPALREAAARAARDLGTGAGASRLITGTLKLHEELETATAAFKGTEAALVFNSGFQANTAAIPALVGEDDVIFSDALNHASLIDGCRLSRARRVVYPHADTAALRELLSREHATRRPGQDFLIVTDAVFSMDGDLAQLSKLHALASEFDARLYVDEAHATGVFGARGRGLCEHAGLDPRNERLIQMGTFSKAFGSFGAYLAGSRELIDVLVNRARGFIYSTALPPAVIAANMAALEIVQAQPELRNRLWERIAQMGRLLSFPAAAEDDNQGTSPIFPLILGTEKSALHLAAKLWDNGIWAQAIRPPTVPPGTARLRLTVTAGHTTEQIQKLTWAIA